MEGFWREWPEVIITRVASRFSLDEEEIHRVAAMMQGMTAAALVRIAAWHWGRERLTTVLEEEQFEQWAREVVYARPVNSDDCDEVRRRASWALDEIFEADRLALTEYFMEECGLSTKTISHLFSYSFLFVLASLPPAEEPLGAHSESLVLRLRREWASVESRLSERERDFLSETLRVRRGSFDTGGYPAIREVSPSTSNGSSSASSNGSPPDEAPSFPRSAFSYIRELLGISPKAELRDDTEER